MVIGVGCGKVVVEEGKLGSECGILYAIWCPEIVCMLACLLFVYCCFTPQQHLSAYEEGHQRVTVLIHGEIIVLIH